MRRLLVVSALFMSMIACSKKSNDDQSATDPIKEEDKAQATAVSLELQKHPYALTKYYSDVPIDYNDTDNVVKAETELWSYVSPWLKDDQYMFEPAGIVTVVQNDIRLETDNSPTLKRSWQVVADKDGVRLDFIGHEYQPLQYRLVSSNGTTLVVWTKWNNAKVFSEYQVVN